MTETLTTQNVPLTNEVLDFCEKCLSWSYGYPAVKGALVALEKIPTQRTTKILMEFIEKESVKKNGQSDQLVQRAGLVLGRVTELLMITDNS